MNGRHPGAKGSEFDWDDLRYVLAVARHGSAGGAARALDVAHATVLRRIQAIEQDFGMRIFERLPTGLVVTESGRVLLAAAESIDKTILENYKFTAGPMTKRQRKILGIDDPDKSCCMIMGIMTYCNHDEHPNADIFWEEHAGTAYHVLEAIRPIPKHTEICTSYGEGWFEERK